MRLGNTAAVTCVRWRLTSASSFASCVALFVYLALPVTGSAQSVSVTPLGWDFGEVTLGDSASSLFRIESTGPFTPVTIGAVTIEDDPFSAFSITDIDPIPPELRAPDFFNVEVTFAPPFPGLYQGILHVESNDIHDNPPDGDVLRSLTGRSTVPEPGSEALWSLLGLIGGAFAGWRRMRFRPRG